MSTLANLPPAAVSEPPDSTAAGLPSITRERLLQYHCRRSRLEFGRRLGWVILLLILVLLVGCCLDALINHAAARWSGGLAVYAVALLGLMWYCLPSLRRPVDFRNTATHIESQTPELVERLLPAVELSQQASRGDSPAFRQQLQQQVAHLIASLDIRHLLPAHHARRVLLAAGLSALILGLACQIPGLHLPHRIARLLLPVANLARVTRHTITIEQPQPNDAMVPVDEIVALVARVAGPTPQHVRLETRGPQSGLQQELEQVPDSAQVKQNRQSKPRYSAAY